MSDPFVMPRVDDGELAIRSECFQAVNHERVDFAMEAYRCLAGFQRHDVPVHFDRTGDLQANEILRLHAKGQIVDDAAIGEEVRNPDLPDLATKTAFAINGA